VPITSLLVWLILAFVPPLIWPTHSPQTPHAPYFPTPLPELLLSVSLFALSHLLHPYLFAFASALLLHPTATSLLGTALHVILRNGLRTAALPLLAIPGGPATFHAPAFRRVWWLALGWSFAEVVAGIAQGYEARALYRDVLVPESAAREFVASASAAAAVAAPTWAPYKSGGSDSASPPPAADERLRESLSRGEDGGPGTDVAGSPVRGRRQPSAWTEATNDDIRLEVDEDFDELVAVKAREELEELYGIPAIVSHFSPPIVWVLGQLRLITARARVRVVLAAHRVDLPIPWHRLAPVGGVPHITPRRAPHGRRRTEGEDSAFVVEPSLLGHILGGVCHQLVPLVATHPRVLTTCRRPRRGVSRAPGRVGDVIRRVGVVGCIIVMARTS
jgi:hypothetical protein